MGKTQRKKGKSQRRTMLSRKMHVGGGCGRSVCPCCCSTPNEDDITDTLVTGVDELDKEDETNALLCSMHP